MEQVLKEYQELDWWKREEFGVVNSKRIFGPLESPFTEEEFELIEEIFCAQIDHIFEIDDMSTDEFDNLFQLENFYPAFVKKDVGSGSWIRIATETGYNVYWAKAAPQKRISEEQLRRQHKKLNHLPKKTVSQLNKILSLVDEIKAALLIKQFPHELKYVRIMRTRTQSEYVLPYQYEIVNDIQLYTEVIRDKMNKGAVKYKSYFTKQDEDQVFYLQSRGIDRDTAVLMCKLQQVYFQVDVPKLFANYMQPV